MPCGACATPQPVYACGGATPGPCPPGQYCWMMNSGAYECVVDTTTLVPEGGACGSPNRCAAGLECVLECKDDSCNSNAWTCRAPGGLDAACIPTAMGNSCDDAQDLSCIPECVDASCTSRVSKCRKPGGLGATCTIRPGDTCDRTLGLVCDWDWNVSDYKCTPLSELKPGQTCDLTSASACVAGARCISGVCVAPVPDGTTCDWSNGPPCMNPAACIDGICQIPDYPACK